MLVGLSGPVKCLTLTLAIKEPRSLITMAASTHAEHPPDASTPDDYVDALLEEARAIRQVLEDCPAPTYRGSTQPIVSGIVLCCL